MYKTLSKLLIGLYEYSITRFKPNVAENNFWSFSRALYFTYSASRIILRVYMDNMDMSRLSENDSRPNLSSEKV